MRSQRRRRSARGFGLLELTTFHPDGSIYTTARWHEKWGGRLPVTGSMKLPVGTYSLNATTTSGLTATGEVTVTSLGEELSVKLTLE